MSHDNFLQQRLHSHCISHTPFAKPHEAATWFGAMQAQDYAHSRWAVGLRCTGATRASVEQAIAARTLVRTWAMRGTLQFVAAQDIRWLVQLVGARIIAKNLAADIRRFELDAVEFVKIQTLFDRILRGQQLTRKETYAALEQQGISTKGQRGYHILNRAGLSGQICFGEWRGKEETFVLLDEWLPPAPNLPRDEALAQLALCYFRSHAPATLKDFVWWSGLAAAEARAALQSVATHLIQEKGEATYWWSKHASPIQFLPLGSAYLLPGFDEYLLGYTDRSPIMPNVQKAHVIHSNGIFKPVMVLDGEVVGTWSRRQHQDKFNVSLIPFKPLTKQAQQKFEAVAQQVTLFEAH